MNIEDVIMVFGHFILFRAYENKLKGGILLPESFNVRTLRLGHYAIGEILSVGDDVKDLKKGDFFVFNEYSVGGADDPKGIQDKEIYTIKDGEIKCRLNEKPNKVWRKGNKITIET